MPSVPLDRSRVPPDVARRLATLAARQPAGGVREPRGASGDRGAPVGPEPAAPAARVGWTPRRPPAGVAGTLGGSVTVALETATLADVAGVPDVAGSRDGTHHPGGGRHPDVAALDDPDPAPTTPAAASPAPAGAADALPWHGDPAAAWAEAAATRPVAAPPRVRWAPGWRATGAAALVLALAAGGLALRALRAPHGELVALPTPAVVAGAADAAADPAGEQVVVHVVGAVAHPGVVRLALGARVADAIGAAGGSTPDADLSAVNLARVLTDGEQLVVPVTGAVPAVTATDAATGLLDLNSADADALDALPGVGPVLAGRIVDRRDARPFTTVDELDEVPGIGPALLEDLRPLVRV